MILIETTTPYSMHHNTVIIKNDCWSLVNKLSQIEVLEGEQDSPLYRKISNSKEPFSMRQRMSPFSSSLSSLIIGILVLFALASPNKKVVCDAAQQHGFTQSLRVPPFASVVHMKIRGGSSASQEESVDALVPQATTTRVLVQHTDLSHKLANLGERTLPAVALLLGLFGIVKVFGGKGLSALLLVLSPGLYQELISVVLDDADTNTNKPIESEGNNSTALEEATSNIKTQPFHKTPQQQFMQWWWFVAMSVPTTLHQYLGQVAKPATLSLVSYSMILAGYIAWIIQLNHSTNADFHQSLKQVAVYHLAGFFSILPVSCWMNILNEFSMGQSWALYAAMLVILNDTMAYVFGFSMGKHALLPKISPKKTWEGWMGAFCSTSLLSCLVWKVFFPMPYGRDSLMVALFCSLVAPFGGFLASAVKRAYNKKDFSNLIAGHGGLVDRLDCQLITAPFVYLMLKAMEQAKVVAEHVPTVSSAIAETLETM